MTSDWKQYTLDEIIDINPTETLRKGDVAKKVAMEKLIPYCRDITNFELSEYNGGTKFRNGDTIMARITPCLENGKISQVRILDEGEIGFGSTEYIIFRAKKDITDIDFVYYLVTSTMVKEPAIKSMVGSSGRQRVQTDVVKNIKINLPPLETQRKIGKVLGAIDDKIVLNNSINKNLEQQMQSIFLELFPFIFNNANDTLEKIISFSNGKKRPENMGTIPVYGGNGILAYSDSSNSENCVIVGRVGAYCGNTFLCTGPCWVSDNAIQAKSKIGDSQLFIFYILKNAHLQSRHIGTGQPLMTQGILNSIPFNMPDISIIKQFTDNCEPMQKLIIDNTIENERLTQLRDTLLPKLMNGEIDVDKVEV